MSKKVFMHNGEGALPKQLLHAEHTKDIKPDLEPRPELSPRNPNTHVSIRLPMDVCDWIWEQYPNEPTISAAVVNFIKDKYGSRTKTGSI